MWLSCLLPVAPAYIPPSDCNIHKYLSWALKHVYAISCTATFWQRKIVAMTYGVNHIHLCLLSIIAVFFKVAPFWVYSMCPAHLPFLEAPLELTVLEWCVGWSATVPEFQGWAGNSNLIAATSVLETRNHKRPAELGKHLRRATMIMFQQPKKKKQAWPCCQDWETTKECRTLEISYF